MVLKIAINGFGRTGRMFLRALALSPVFGKDAQVLAINDVTDSATLAHLFKYDSVQRALPLDVYYRSDALAIGNNVIRMFKEQDPAVLPWEDIGVDYVVDCTGMLTDKESAKKHIQAGARKVLIAAPGSGVDATLIYGVNSDRYDPGAHYVISTGSTTTHCAAVLCKMLHESFKIKRGFLTAVHAYTSNQVLTDQTHPDLRRARAAAMNIVPTTSGADKALGEVLPDLAGKIRARALRVPVPDGSMVQLTAEVVAEVTAQDVNAAVRGATEGPLAGVAEYSEEEIVSSDVLGNPASCVFDSALTRIAGGAKGNMVEVSAWYDNEWAYASRLVDLVKFMGSKELL